MANANQYLPPITRDKCGTTAGYQKHRWEHELYCEPCTKANRLYINERRKDPLIKEKRAKEAHKRRQSNLKEYRRREIISQAKRKDKKDIYDQEYRAENREEINRKTREYKKANPELIKAQAAAYYQRNKEARAEYRAMNRENAKAWRQANPELFRLYNRKRKAAKLNTLSEPYTTEVILETHGTDCYLCHEPIDLDAPRRSGVEGYEKGLQLDHVIPLSRGGTDLISNVKPSHASCNLSKHSTLLEHFVLQS